MPEVRSFVGVGRLDNQGKRGAAMTATDDGVRLAETLIETLQGMRGRLRDFKNFHATPLCDGPYKKRLLDTIERLDSEMAEEMSRLLPPSP